MNDAEIRSYEAFLRMREFASAETARLAGNAFAMDLFANLNTIIDGLDAQAAAQSSGKSGSKQGVSGMNANAEKLLAQMKAISRTARAMEQTTPGMAGKFRVPAGLKRQELLNLARVFAEDAAPLKAEFVKRGLPALFLDTLGASVTALEQSINEKIQSVGTQVKATAAVGSLIEQDQSVRLELDVIMRNLFAADPATLAAWDNASRIERAPRTRKKAEIAPPA